MLHTPYYYAPGGKYVLFLDLLGFTAFVRSSFQKKAEETDDREKEFELAQKQASSPSLNAFCRAPQTSGCKPRSITSSGCSSCSSLKESRTTEIGLIEPP